VIGRLIAAEVAGLRRSLLVWLAMLLVVGGSVVARVTAWVNDAIGRTELSTFPFVRPDVRWSDMAIPLALLAYLIVTSYVFGRDFEDGNIDLVLTAPVRRDAVVVARTIVIATGVLVLALMGWGADAAMRAVLFTSSFDPGPATSATAAFGSAIAAIATLPLVAWAAVRFRGVLPAIGLGIALEVAGLALGGFALARMLPWFLPMSLAAGGSASWLAVSLSLLLFAGGLAATARALRTVDLYE
jgi:ABC-2 type transport system permease protein